MWFCYLNWSVVTSAEDNEVVDDDDDDDDMCTVHVSSLSVTPSSLSINLSIIHTDVLR
jgi:hypothetical protein